MNGGASQFARVMDHVIASMMFPPATGRLAVPCEDCGEHEIVCRCVRDGDAADAFTTSENHHSADLIEDAIATVQAACRENLK